jgi:hypothetical protein
VAHRAGILLGEQEIDTNDHPTDPEEVNTQVKFFTHPAVGEIISEIIIGEIKTNKGSNYGYDMNGPGNGVGC